MRTGYVAIAEYLYRLYHDCSHPRVVSLQFVVM